MNDGILDEFEYPHNTRTNHKLQLDYQFSLDGLPLHLQLTIIRKFDFATFINATQCSKQTRRICENHVKERYPYCVETICVYEENISIYKKGQGDLKTILWKQVKESRATLIAEKVQLLCILNDIKCKQLLEEFRLNRTTAHTIMVDQPIECDPVMCEELLEQLGISEFQSADHINNEILKLPAFKMLRSIEIANCSATDSELLGLRAKYISLFTDHVTASGISTFLKEWQDGKRELNSLTVNFQTTFGVRTIEEVMQYVHYKVLWSVETHANTIIGSFPIESLSIMGTTYSIKRKNSDLTIIVRVFDILVDAHLFDEAEYLTNMLSTDEYYNFTGTCWQCHEEYCLHYGRYSLGNLRRKYPIILRAINKTAVLLKHCVWLYEICVIAPTDQALHSLCLKLSTLW